MASKEHAAFSQEEWDLVWQEYDRRSAKPTSPQPDRPEPVATASSRQLGPWLVLTGFLFAAPAAVAVLSDPWPGRLPGATILTGLLTLAPEEAELPPLSVSVSRLAAESTRAACWVKRLDAGGQPCLDDIAEAGWP